MWVLIASECFLFGSLIVNYLINRDRGLAGPTARQIYDIDITTLSTFDLLMSSVAMVLALHACQNRELQKFRFWTGMVVLGGVIFLGFQFYEFSHFVHLGLGLTTNVFGSSFYLLTGCHGAHVFLGVLWMSSILATSFVRGENWFPSLPLEVAGLYWHFVDVVWIIIFTVVYLFVYI
ncbi:MAG: cytochrome c oxidase subunit 3 [Deltaproteobacteria bacterium]|nr:cytochrome c oxidase subunit 3 [Deltaproteobacteria bacterium]